MIKNSVVIVFAAAGAAASAQTVAQWDLLGAAGSQAFTTGSAVANVTALNLTRGAGLGANAGGNSLNSNGWNGQTTDYVSLGFSVAAGWQVSLSSLYIGSQASATGPGTLGLFSSVDNFTSSLFTFNQAPGANPINNVVNLSSLTNLTGNVEFRIYQVGTASANGGATGASGTFRVTGYFVGGTFDRNLQFTGSVTQVPTPAAAALFGVAGIAGLRRRR